MQELTHAKTYSTRSSKTEEVLRSQRHQERADVLESFSTNVLHKFDAG